MPVGFSAKMERFCQEYLIDLNGTQAAIRAGYSQDTASAIATENLSKPSIIARIDELKIEKAEAASITPEFVLKGLKTVAERTMQGVQVYDNEGNPTGEWKFDSAGANRSLELLGKHLTLFADRVEHTGKNGGPIDFSEESNEERAIRFAALLQSVASVGADESHDSGAAGVSETNSSDTAV